MIEQKVIEIQYIYSDGDYSFDIKEIGEELSKGWRIKFQPSIVQAFGNYAPKVIVVFEREIEEKTERGESVKKEKSPIYSWWMRFDHDANGLNGCRCVECGYEDWYYKDKEPDECPNCHAKMDNIYV